jgi:hypothetical protein
MSTTLNRPSELRELDQFFVRYGELVKPGHGLITDCVVHYGQGRLTVYSPREVVTNLGEDSIKYAAATIARVACGHIKFLASEPLMLCRITFQGNVAVGRITMPNWCDMVDKNVCWVRDPVGIRMMCEELMGRETPLMDWLQDNHDDFYKMVSR